MNLKNAILQEFQACLFTKDIDVDVKEDGDQVTFAVLVGKGKMGGLHFSATIARHDLSESLQCAMKIFNAQLVLYAIECLKKGVQAKVKTVFVPQFTDTVFIQNVGQAQSHYEDLASVVRSFDVFKGTYFGGYRIPKSRATAKKTTEKASVRRSISKKLKK